VAPDGYVNDGYDFARLGVRVPAVLVSPWLEHRILHDVFDHTSLLRFLTDLWELGPLGARTAAANSFASSWSITAAPRTNTPARIAEPVALPNLIGQRLNANQVALVGFSRFLETKNAAMAAKQSPAAARAMTMQIGTRLVQSMEDDRHGETAALRVDQFLGLARRVHPQAGAAGASNRSIARQKKLEKQAASKIPSNQEEKLIEKARKKSDVAKTEKGQPSGKRSGRNKTKKTTKKSRTKRRR
jgi:hypothetical protein